MLFAVYLEQQKIAQHQKEGKRCKFSWYKPNWEFMEDYQERLHGSQRKTFN